MLAGSFSLAGSGFWCIFYPCLLPKHRSLGEVWVASEPKDAQGQPRLRCPAGNSSEKPLGSDWNNAEHQQEECSVSPQVLNVFLVKQHLVTPVLESLKWLVCDGGNLPTVLSGTFSVHVFRSTVHGTTPHLAPTEDKESKEFDWRSSPPQPRVCTWTPATPGHLGSQVESVHRHRQGASMWGKWRPDHYVSPAPLVTLIRCFI